MEVSCHPVPRAGPDKYLRECYLLATRSPEQWPHQGEHRSPCGLGGSTNRPECKLECGQNGVTLFFVFYDLYVCVFYYTLVS